MDQNHEIGIYVHIPFCVRKCGYCDFLSFAAGEDEMERYADALLEEIRGWGEELSGYRVASVFFGGGTPSILPVMLFERIAEGMRMYLPWKEERASFGENLPTEVSIECNPGTLSEEKTRTYAELGINRVSLGLQSADDGLLKRLGRIHTWNDFRISYDLVREAGIQNVNVDLMSGLPGQTLEQWMTTLKRIAALHPEHISAYSLILEEGTPFDSAYRDGKSKDGVCLPDEETERIMYERTGEFLRERGLYRYEISNYAKSGYECRHNIGYWKRREYLGFGLGASSFFQGRRWRNPDSLTEYRSVCHDRMRLRREELVLDRKDAMEEFMFLGLRMCEGVSAERFLREFHVSMDRVYGRVIERLIAGGLIRRTRNGIALTDRGIEVSNPVLAEFLLDESY